MSRERLEEIIQEEFDKGYDQAVVEIIWGILRPLHNRGIILKQIKELDYLERESERSKKR